MFGVDAFEFDAGIGFQLQLDDEPEDLAEILGQIHKNLLSAGRHSLQRRRSTMTEPWER
jgi:hypothetical protein